MKKILYLMFLFVTPLLFSACSSDDDDPTSIVGTWELKTIGGSTSYTINGAETDAVYLVLKSDGTGYISVEYSDYEGDETYYFEYVYNEDGIQFLWTSVNYIFWYEGTTYDYSLFSGSLSIENWSGRTMIFKRK